MIRAKYSIGDLVCHTRQNYRGVVVDIDEHFALDEAWYERVAQSRPPKDKPWYKVLVHGTSDATYVAERHLKPDTLATPINHPLVAEFFDAFARDHYERQGDLN